MMLDRQRADTITPIPRASPSSDEQRVTAVRHWTDRLFSFRITRPQGMRFRSGEFVMIGLPGNEGRPLLRAYSIASANWDDELEFFSIKVPDGPLTSRLQKIAIGDSIVLRPKSTGTLVLDALLPGKRLYLFSTGTGIAPFASLIRDPETYEKFDEVVLTHTCRGVAELEYGRTLIQDMADDPLISDFVQGKLRYYPSVTQEPFHTTGRITDILSTGKLFTDLNLPDLGLETDRAMICGSIGLNKSLKSILSSRGLDEGSNNQPAHFVIERAFVG